MYKIYKKSLLCALAGATTLPFSVVSFWHAGGMNFPTSMCHYLRVVYSCRYPSTSALIIVFQLVLRVLRTLWVHFLTVVSCLIRFVGFALSCSFLVAIAAVYRRQGLILIPLLSSTNVNFSAQPCPDNLNDGFRLSFCWYFSAQLDLADAMPLSSLLLTYSPACQLRSSQQPRDPLFGGKWLSGSMLDMYADFCLFTRSFFWGGGGLAINFCSGHHLKRS